MQMNIFPTFLKHLPAEWFQQVQPVTKLSHWWCFNKFLNCSSEVLYIWLVTCGRTSINKNKIQSIPDHSPLQSHILCTWCGLGKSLYVTSKTTYHPKIESTASTLSDTYQLKSRNTHLVGWYLLLSGNGRETSSGTTISHNLFSFPQHKLTASLSRNYKSKYNDQNCTSP